MSDRRTIRRYAHELYPHPNEYEVRALEVEVPYLYARFIGLNTFGTDWFALWPGDHEKVFAFLREKGLVVRDTVE